MVTAVMVGDADLLLGVAAVITATAQLIKALRRDKGDQDLKEDD